MEIDGNAGVGGDAIPQIRVLMYFRQVTSFEVTQASPQILSDLLIPSIPWLVTHL